MAGTGQYSYSVIRGFRDKMAGTGQYSYSVIRGFRRQDGRNRPVQL